MAKSGSTRYGVTPWNTLIFSWSLGSQSVANNTSFIRWELTLEARSSGRIDSTAQKTWTIYVNGTKYTGTNTIGISNNSTKTLAVGSTTIKHNDDGTATFTCRIYQVFNITFNGSEIGQIVFNAQGELDTIARASQPSCVTWPEHTQNVGYFGNEISIHMNRKSAGFTHTVRYQFGAQSGTIATGVETGTKWVIPTDLINLIPNSIKGSGTIYVDTYNGSTLVGTKSCGFTATVPSNVKPSCTVTVSDPTGYATTYGNYVKGLSKFNVTINPTLAYGSSIKTYGTTANGSKYATQTFTTGVLNSSGTLNVVATVTDSRGRSGSASNSPTVLDYTVPTISKLTVGRCDSDGTANEQGAYVQATFSASVTALNNKNTATYKLRYKKTLADTYTEVTISALNNTYSVTNHKYVFAADTGSSYDVEVSVADDHSTSTRSTSAPTAFTLMHWNANGTGIGIGKVSEKSNTLEVAIDAEFNGEVKTSGNRYCFSSPGTAGTAGYVRMVRMTHKKANADTPITFVFTRRLCPHPMTVHVQFRTDSTTIDPDLKGISYEGDNYGAFLVRSQESIWDLYVEKVSAYDTITLQEWYSSATVSDRLTVDFVGELASEVPTGLDGYYRATPAKMQSILDFIYPVGSVYISYSHVDPGTLFGGTWTRIQNAFLWGVDSSGAIGQTGGEKTVTLTANQIPAHNHGGTYTNAGSAAKTHAWLASGGSAMAYDTVDTGGGEAHNNMPPYIQVSIWRRTA